LGVAKELEGGGRGLCVDRKLSAELGHISDLRYSFKLLKREKESKVSRASELQHGKNFCNDSKIPRDGKGSGNIGRTGQRRKASGGKDRPDRSVFINTKP